MDEWTSQVLNQLVGQHMAFDLFLDFVQDSYLVKGLFATCVLVMLLFSRTPDPAARRGNVYATLLLVFIALFVGRVLQMVLPFTPRPLYAEGMNLVLAEGLGQQVLMNDSSFPSDHALMFVTLAASVLFYHRIAGTILMLHALVVVCLPRLILGFHWLSDIVVGAAIGLLIAVALHRPMARWITHSRLLRWESAYPAAFLTVLFIILCENATMYSGSRKILSAAKDFAALAL